MSLQIGEKYLQKLMFLLMSTVVQLQESGINLEPIKANCQKNGAFGSADSNITVNAFLSALRDVGYLNSYLL